MQAVPFIGTAKQMEAGCDWISVTAVSPGGKSALHRAASEAIESEVSEGADVTPWRWRDYEGWRTEHAAWGERSDSFYCQLGSGRAWRDWRKVLVPGCRVTRLDVQVTVSGVPLYADLARQQFDELEQRSGSLDRSRTYSWYCTRPTGSTLYVGSPRSDTRLRLYDKGAEQPERYPAGSWRYESQTRGSVARLLASALAGDDGDPIACDVAVYQHYCARRLRPVFRPSGSGVLGHPKSPERSDERTLRWLRTQVRAALSKLDAHGRRGDALSALGIHGGE